MRFFRWIRRNAKRILQIAVSALATLLIVVMPVTTAIVYESIFRSRYETEPYLSFSVEDFEGLSVERSDFSSDGVTLAGYKYTKSPAEPRGVLVLSHGMGGGGHNEYLPLIDYVASHGYLAFAYDARGNDESEGEAVEGLPQGVVDLDAALCHVATIEEYQGLPVVLLGHSWGGYSAGNVLSMHPEVRAAAIFAGFNESEDLLSYQSRPYAGPTVGFGLFYLEIYERIKFGTKYTDSSAIEQMAGSTAGVMIVQSSDDRTVPAECGYDRFWEAFGSNDRFTFLLYEDRGHERLFYSDGARAYREDLQRDFLAYCEGNGCSPTEEVRRAYMEANLDRERYFELDEALMAQVVALYDAYCVGEY